MYFGSSNFNCKQSFFVTLQTMVDFILYNTSCVTTLYKDDNFEQVYKVFPEDGL
jgi:hypothetical protein